MKYLIASDLHFEFQKNCGASLLKMLPKDVDGIIVAGDVSTGKGNTLDVSLDMLCGEYEAVIYTLGNHDLYDSSPQKVFDQMVNIDDMHKNLYWMNRSILELGGIRFVGCSMWFPHVLDWYKKSKYISDFRCIEGYTPWVFEENKRDMKFLKENATSDSIVITHHMPSNKCIAPEFKDSTSNCFFVCPGGQEIIDNNKPRAWVYGHTHSMWQYMDGNSLVCACPFGYPGENEYVPHVLHIQDDLIEMKPYIGDDDGEG